MHRRARRLLLACGLLLASLALVELGVRLLTNAEPALVTRDAAVGMRHLRSFEGRVYMREPRRVVALRFDRDGFRGPDRPYAKPQGTRRLAILGDSMVAALEVDEEHTFASRLESLLAASHPEDRWEVLNFGVAGSSLGPQWPLLRELVLRYEPDLVLACFFAGNDFGDLSREIRPNAPMVFEPDERGLPRQVDEVRPRSRSSHWLNRYSRAYSWQRSLLRPLRPGRLMAASLPREKWINCTEHDEVLERVWRTSEALIAAARDTAEAAGARYALVLVPAAEHVHPARFEALMRAAGPEGACFDPDHADRRLSALCARLGVPYLSLLPALRAAAAEPAPAPPEGWLFLNGDGHFAERGHRVVAEALHALLAGGDGPGAGLLGPPR